MRRTKVVRDGEVKPPNPPTNLYEPFLSIKLFCLMTDSQFTKLLRRTAAALTKHNRLLIEAQDEYSRRYGELPGDHDNDSWIDRLEGGGGEGDETVTAKDVDEWAVACGRDSWQNDQVQPTGRPAQ